MYTIKKTVSFVAKYMMHLQLVVLTDCLPESITSIAEEICIDTEYINKRFSCDILLRTSHEWFILTVWQSM